MLAVFVFVFIPLATYSRGQSGEVVRVPEITNPGNSQTMILLEGYLNINPTGLGGVEIAIADGVALSAEGVTGESFLESGKSGHGQISVYTVRKGDTLSEIAEMHGVSTNTIIWANNLRNSGIKEGQELIILPISGVRHVVKSGDTLASIAKNYKAELSDVLSYNDLSANSKIKSGDMIIIPNGIAGVSVSSVVARSSGRSSSDLPTYSGYYLRPIVGGIKSQGIHGYNAVDIAASVGTPVMASASGEVIFSIKGGYNGGYGTYVIISHPNGTQTLYAHMSANYISRGDNVLQGQTIGAVGNTGHSTGPHLHFEVRGARNPF